MGQEMMEGAKTLAVSMAAAILAISLF